ncbi:MAG: hypothetical protein ABIO95_06765, partial [Bdellovibrionota bacterium]
MKNSVKLSVIIPVRNFEAQLSQLVETLEFVLIGYSILFEIIVCAAPNSDLGDLRNGSATQILESAREGRSYQLNDGAEKSSGEWLFFVHADSVLDSNAIVALLSAT